LEPRALKTNIDMDLQKFVLPLWGDSLQGGAIALDPKTGACSRCTVIRASIRTGSPAGIPPTYWKELNTDPRRPLFNKVIQGTYRPARHGSLRLRRWDSRQELVTMDSHMPSPVPADYSTVVATSVLGKKGHGQSESRRAITHRAMCFSISWDSRSGSRASLQAGGSSIPERSGIDSRMRSSRRFPRKDVKAYYDRLFGP
jgi:penicillin-binding protein 2